MGSSGAGKSTLMTLLAQRVNTKSDTITVSGDIRINNGPISANILSKHSGYVLQDDILMQTQTPRESLQFSANLRLPTSLSPSEKQTRVQKLLDALNLTKAAETRIGGVTNKGISGGERKRTNIGIELVTDPSLLFIDEPTSGLDSTSALNVIFILKALAHRQNRTVITIIHQPSSEAFDEFDDLLLLAAGRVLYHGPAKDALAWFKHVGYACPDRTNPADHFMVR